jgi:hypothetical protein
VSANFKIAVPFVGTPLRDMAAEFGEIDEDDYRNFKGDPERAVFVADGLTREYLTGVQRRAYFRFYSEPMRLLRIGKTMTGKQNLAKWGEGAKIMGRLLRHQAMGPEKGVLPTFLEFEH